MKVELDLSALKSIRWYEDLARFLFGGAVSVIAGVIAQILGPQIGGLFLAFPAILPATLTLIEKHDGRKKAFDDTRGAVLGSLGLAVFAWVVWRASAIDNPALLLTSAAASWLLTSLILFGAASLLVWKR
jgi:hypothetical protein